MVFTACVRYFVLVFGMVLFLGAPSMVASQGVQPNLKVSLVLNKNVYLFNDVADPIKARIEVQNFGGGAITTIPGFAGQSFHLQLVFQDPDKQLIQFTELGASEGLAPLQVSIQGQRFQVVPVSIVDAGPVTVLEIPNLLDFYDLPKPGRYSVQIFSPIQTYSAFFPASGVPGYSRVPEDVEFSGALTSNVAEFTLVGDLDSDLYAFPIADSRISSFTSPDCNDNDPAINPGQPEIFGDGIDNDCNAATLDDAVAPAQGDLDGDQDTDRDDLNIVVSARNMPASGPDDPRDLDGDGLITGLDARRLLLQCTRPRCATE